MSSVGLGCVSVMENRSVLMYFDEEGLSSYSHRNIYATQVHELELKYIRQALHEQARTLENSDGPFTIADFGTADGLGFIQILPEIVEIIRFHYGPDKQVSVVFEDMPQNDFKSIFRTFSETLSGEKVSVSGRPLHNVFVTASGTSFYKQCLPDNTLSLVCCSTALHFLSERPCLTETCLPCLYDDIQNTSFQKQGEKDLEKFLLLRAKELRTGGFMVLFVNAIDEDARSTGCVRHHSLLKTVCDLWIDFSKRGIITKEELRQCTYPVLLRTKNDLLKPFEGVGSPVKASGLRVHSIEKVILQPSTYEDMLTRFTQTKDKETVTEYAVGMVNVIKSWSYSFKYGGLNPSRTDKEKRDIMDSYYTELVYIISQNPLENVMNYLYYSMLITKK